MKSDIKANRQLARKLILDELFDYLLYKKLAGISDGNLLELLNDLIPVEKRHFDFWQSFFGVEYKKLDFFRMLKLQVIFWLCRLFGKKAIHLTLEALEVYGARKYLAVWEQYKEAQLGKAAHEILHEELGHEDKMVSLVIERQIDGERVRDVFLGLNDGLVEILGAVSGFFAAFESAGTVLMAGFTVAVAGAVSMAAGVYVALSSEKEVELAEKRKEIFLGDSSGILVKKKREPLGEAFLVGISYLIGSMVPILPVLFGARSVLISALASAAVIVLVSFVVAFISGMSIKKRIITNTVIIALAVGITYVIGTIVKNILGIRI